MIINDLIEDRDEDDEKKFEVRDPKMYKGELFHIKS